MFGLLDAFASERYAKISLGNADFKYPLPNDWCDATETELGVVTLAYLQAVNDAAVSGLNIRLILKPCKSTETGYPWAFVALDRVDKIYSSNQFVFNKALKVSLKHALTNDSLNAVKKHNLNFQINKLKIRIYLNLKNRLF